MIAAAALLCLAGGAYARTNADQALAIAVDGPGQVNGTGIACRDGSGDCVELYADGTSVTLTAVSDAGATFTGWGGDCTASGTNATCTLTLSSARAVTATFTSGGGDGGNPILTVSATGNGKVTGNGINCGAGNTDCSESYSPGTVVTLSETPNMGATFSGWGGACSGTATTCNVTMNSSQTVTATFSGSLGNATLTVSPSGDGKITGSGIACSAGSTECSENYTPGTSVTLTAVPNTGATFLGWGGDCSGTSLTCTIVMSTARSVTAAFSTAGSTRKILTVSIGGSGRVTGAGITCGAGARDCAQAYDSGTGVVLTATPAAGAVFLGWGGACHGTSRTCALTMTAPMAVSASFSTPRSRAGSTFPVHSNGAPLVARTSVGWAVTLRFFTARSAGALLRLSLNGRAAQAFTFSPRAGNVLVGPFNVMRPGTYRFRMTLSDGRGGVAGLHWKVQVR